MRTPFRTQRELTAQLYTDVITIDPLGNRFAAQGTDKHGVDRLGEALPEQKREWRDNRKAVQRQSTKETVAMCVISAVIGSAFLLGRISLGSNPLDDIQATLEFLASFIQR